MKAVEKRGRTVEEALQAALKELGAEREKVEVDVLEEGNKGLFGILGSKEARVRVRVKESKSEIARRLLEEICAALKIEARVEADGNENYIYLNIKGINVGALIGRRGQTLEALQYLINVAAGRASNDKQKIILDVEDYRKRREKTLRELALRLAEKVRRTKERVVLEPMSSHERRVIHLALQDNPFVYTRSEGEDPYRKVVIASKEEY